MSQMDDKKKLMIIGALGVVFLGVGVFQFTKGSTPPPAPAPVVKQDAKVDKDEDADGEQAKPEAQNTLVTGSYPARDPFKALVDSNPPQPTMTPVAQPMPTRRTPVGRMPDFPIEKFSPLPGTPVAGGAGGEVTPIKPPAPEFGYKLAGVMLGKKPVAVFTDAQGAQRLVELGGSLDGDTRLLDIDRDHVVVRFKNQTKTLTLGGGNSSAN